MTKLADDPQTEAAKKAVEADKKVLERSRAEYAERSKGKPTPTQEENDLAMHGAHILEHEPDGSDPDPANKPLEHRPQHQDRHVEAERSPAKPQNYQTRQHRVE
jgi:hypothetical protein